MDINNKNINYNTENSIFFTIARMNPPTPGHLFLIEKLIEEALKRNVHKVFVILSKSNSDNENPIECKEKIDVLGHNVEDLNSMTYSIKEKMINNGYNPEIIKNFNIIFICVGEKENSPVQTLGRIINTYKDIDDLNLFVIIGEDRQNLVDSLTDLFYNKDPNIKSIDSVVLKRESMKKYKGLNKDELIEMDMKSVPVNAFSASFIRNIVFYGLKDKFYDIYRPFLKDDSRIENLYNSIKNGLVKPFPKSKSERITPMKYTYPLIKLEKTSRIYLDEETPKQKKQRNKVGGKRKTKKYLDGKRKRNKKQTKRRIKS